jgi:hypothetical protein
VRHLNARLKKLEARYTPRSRVRNTVLTIDAATGNVIGKAPKGPCMVVTKWPTNAAWEQALRSQQTRLINEGTPT